jgi:hypothetical protein
MLRWKVLVALAGLAVLAAEAFVLWPREDRITEDNFQRIKDGMTRREVEAILGPPGDHASGPVAFPVRGEPKTWEGRRAGGMVGGSMFCWVDDSFFIGVGFDHDDNVRAVVSGPLIRKPQGPFDNLVWRAERQWRRWFPE